MSSIDAVIARARRPGALSSRQTFTLARTRAIQKMRHFALANPHNYVLELVQASIASGATYVAIEVDHTTFTLSYIGGGFPEVGLANLFDLLFASKERTDLAALRTLALGVNALLLFHPERLIVESGDGTLAGTSRLEIHSGADRLEVGRPEHPLSGTFVRVEGLRRDRMSSELKLPIRGRGEDERAVIESRCICAPVPILFNSEALFGHSSVRIPRSFGLRSIEFDEGDLYGSLALTNNASSAIFRLLTYGVWIESIEHPLIPGQSIGGSINYDTLHKSADHARIVRDERLDELWIRLRPYAEMLLRHERKIRAAYDVTIFGGVQLPSKQLRLFLREIGRAVIIPPSVREGSAKATIARRIADALDAELLTADLRQLDRLRILAGTEANLVVPDLDSHHDLAVFTRPPASEPERPWILSAIEGPRLGIPELAAEAAQGDTETHQAALAAALGGRGEATITIYTPASAAGSGTLEIHLTTLGRPVATVAVISAYGGHVITAELPNLQPSALLQAPEQIDAIAGAIARRCTDSLREASHRALYGLRPESIAPKTPEAHIALAALQRMAIARLRRNPEHGIEVTLSPLEQLEGLDLFALPLLATLSGESLTLRDLPALLRAGEGVLYGVIPEIAADLEGLDTARILDLDRESERLLIALLGEAAYVRVDARDLLAEVGSLRIRDFAVGLRDFPSFAEFPHLVEGGDPRELAPEAQREAELALFAQLLEVYNLDPTAAESAEARALAEELRRQAFRHLQRYLCGQRIHPRAAAGPPLGMDLVIAIDGDGHGCTLREILAGFEHHGTIIAHYDHGSLPSAGLPRHPEDAPPPAELAVSPFFYRQLAGLVGADRLTLPFDFALLGETSAAEEARETAAIGPYLATVTVREPRAHGTLGIPLEPPEVPRIIVIDNQRRTFTLRGIACEYGIVGVLHGDLHGLDEGPFNALIAALHRAAAEALTALSRRLPELDPGSPAATRALTVLLDHAGRNLSLVASPSGMIVPSTSTAIAGQILTLPLFPGRHGLPIHASAILRSLAQESRRRPGEPLSGLLFVDQERLDPLRRDWLERHLHTDRIARPANHGRAKTGTALAQAASPERFDGIALCATISRWIEALRPDPPLLNERVGSRTVVFLADDSTRGEGDPPCWVTPVGGSATHVLLNPRHWLVRWASRVGEAEPKALAWLLLAVYAEINILLELVTNHHEQAFQRNLASALVAGSLRPVAPVPMV